MATFRGSQNAALLSAFLLFSLSGIAQSPDASSSTPQGAPVSGTQPGSQPDAPVPANAQPAATEAKHAEAERELKQEEKQRMLGVVPDFTSVRSGQAVALSPGQKFRLALADGVDPYDFVTSALDAALEQKSNEFPEYGQGWAGYAKRFGAAYADDFDGELVGEGVLPSLLHQDPRYFRLGHGGFRRRLGYSLLSAVRCRGDNGNWQFSASAIGGDFAAGAISNAYYPAADRGFGLTMQRGSIDLGETLLQSLASEFYPDVAQALFHRHPKQPTSSTP